MADDTTITEATKAEITRTIKADAASGRWDRSGGNGRGERTWTTQDGTTASAGRDGDQIVAWAWHASGALIWTTEI